MTKSGPPPRSTRKTTLTRGSVDEDAKLIARAVYLDAEDIRALESAETGYAYMPMSYAAATSRITAILERARE